MSNCKIIKAKYGITEGGIACGPVSGYVVVSIEFEMDNEKKFLSVVEVEAMPIFYLTDDEIFEKLVTEVDDEEFIDYRDAHQLYDFDGIDLSSCDYDCIFDSLSEQAGGETYSLIKYAIAITRLDEEQTNKLIEESEGKLVTEIDIPEIDD